MINNIFEIRSLILFYILFFIMLIILVISKGNTWIVLLSLFLGGIIFLIRLMKRRVKLRNLDYFDIEDPKHKVDAVKRADQIGDIVSIIMFLFLAISLEETFFLKFGDNIFVIMIFCSIFYFITMSISISTISRLNFHIDNYNVIISNF